VTRRPDVAHAHNCTHAAGVTAGALERWLIDAGLAEPTGATGRLAPTPLAHDLAARLAH
jgi:hypothetical protein